VAQGFDETTALTLAAALEKGSEHPLASAILAAASERNIEIEEVSEFQALSGAGVKAVYKGQKLHIGNTRLMQQHAIDISELEPSIKSLAQKGETSILLAVDQKLVALFGIADPVRADSALAIKRLQQLGLKVIMLTGDNAQTAQTVASMVGIDQVIAEVLPADKSEKVAELQRQGHRVAMVGDGINDAPALAQSNVGIAIGSGTDVAIESADIALMRNSLHGVADAIGLSRATMANIKQNLFGAFVYNTLGIPVAAGALFPFFGILLSPMIAAAAMSLSSVTVVSNALRLKRIKI